MLVGHRVLSGHLTWLGVLHLLLTWLSVLHLLLAWLGVLHLLLTWLGVLHLLLAWLNLALGHLLVLTLRLVRVVDMSLMQGGTELALSVSLLDSADNAGDDHGYDDQSDHGYDPPEPSEVGDT